MEVCINDMSVVPEIEDFNFDLTSMDTFDDLDISMENFDIINTNSDPFGDFHLEKSLNFLELENSRINSEEDQFKNTPFILLVIK